MIGFASIAGGAPSSAGAMTDHLLNNTLTPEGTKLAAYYGRGMVQDPMMVDLAQQVADSDIIFSEAVSELVGRYLDEGGDIDLLETAEARLEKRLGDLSFRIQEGLQDAPLAVLRPDLQPIVAQGLGIDPDGMLNRDEINALLSGRRADGELIQGKHYAEERRLPVDPKTGEEKFSTPIGAYDFCPTPDKSVSVAWGFSSPIEQALIHNAHIEAAREAVGYIADTIGKARLGKGGRDGSVDGRVAWLEFTHHTARRVQITTQDGETKITRDAGTAGDPDLHTHFLIPNAVFVPATETEAARVGSLDTAAIGGFIFEADAFYHARLGQKLRDAGFEVALDPKTGAARMTSVPREVCDLFSKRTNIGEELARKVTADRGEIWDELSQDQREARTKTATQDLDQKSKGGKDDVADVADWKRQAKDKLGWEPTTFQLYGPPLPELTQEQRIRKAYEVALPILSERLEHKAVVPHWDLRVAAARGLVETGISGLDDIDAVTNLMRTDGVEQYGGKTALVWGHEDGKRSVSVTTALHEADEQEFIRLAQAASTDHRGALPAKLLEQKIAESGLDLSGAHGQAQRAAMERLGMGGRFSVALGAAGSGKTATLKPLVAAWREQGRAVFGASLAWRQADDLVAAGIDQRNVKAFSVLIDGLRDGSSRLARDAVVAVDEWGLLGTRQGLELLRLQAQHGFQVVALGDVKQAASIQAGALIDLSRRALGAEHVPEVVTTMRQQTDREREIVGLLRQGRAAEALAMKRADGTAEMAFGGYDQVVERVAKLYRERLTVTGEAPTISAPTNSDAQRISAAVRVERRDMGLLGPDLRTVAATDGERDYNLALAKGDRVRLFKSVGAKFGEGRGGNIGRNGSVLEVVNADDTGLTLRAKSGKVGTVAWEALTSKKAGRVQLAYGDAMTIHTAQGSTAQEHIFALPSGSQAVDGLLGYTASTRHRQAGYLITSEAAERVAVRKRRPLNDTREITADDKWANVARAFAYQPEKDTASALLERVGEVRRGTVRTFQQILLPAEIQQASRQPPSMGHEIVMQKQAERELGRDIEGRTLRTVLREAIQRIQSVYRRDSVTRPTISQADRDAAFERAAPLRPADDTARREHTINPSQGLSL